MQALDLTCVYIFEDVCVTHSLEILSSIPQKRNFHQKFQVPKMEVRYTYSKLYGYGLCKGKLKPAPKIA